MRIKEEYEGEQDIEETQFDHAKVILRLQSWVVREKSWLRHAQSSFLEFDGLLILLPQYPYHKALALVIENAR